MRLTEISHAEVQRAINRTPIGSTCTELNTSFHSASDAPGLDIPSEAPYNYARWLPLIARSQSVRESRVRRVRLTKSQNRLLISTAEGSIPTRELNRIYREEIGEEITPVLTRQLSFSEPQGYFLRLDACSPKDGNGGVEGLKGVQAIIMRLVTSLRALSAMRRLEESGQPLDLFFLPFDDSMQTQREYRVFCPPGCGRISAISQYGPSRRWMMADETKDERARIAERVVEEAERTFTDIKSSLDITSEFDALIMKQGLSFDLCYDEVKNKGVLVELNAFGARGPAGSCLFHWIKDREVLYDLAGDEIEFRVAV